MNKRALITGIAGQDGSYLTELLQSKNYEVHGIERPGRRASPASGIRLHYVDLGARGNLEEILDSVRPDEVYNLAGASRVSASFDDPVGCAAGNGLGAVEMLEAVRRHRDRTGRDVRFFQASSSEMFGSTGSSLADESTPLHPRSPYGCAKAFAHFQTVNYREAFGLFACSGILFNHESPRRETHFVTRKITSAAAQIKLGRAERLSVGNVDVRRDWGFAGEYVEAMWLMLQQDRPDDYVIATGQSHSVREFGEAVFAHLGLDWSRHAVVEPKLFRPIELEHTCGDASKARRILGWRPRVDFPALARMMADYDLELALRTQS